jgi:hypothetical protein
LKTFQLSNLFDLETYLLVRQNPNVFVLCKNTFRFSSDLNAGSILQPKGQALLVMVDKHVYFSLV